MKPKYPVTYKGLTVYDAKGREVVTYHGDYMRKHMEDACDELNRRRYDKIEVAVTKGWNEIGPYTQVNVRCYHNKWRDSVLEYAIGILAGVGIFSIMRAIFDLI